MDSPNIFAPEQKVYILLMNLNYAVRFALKINLKTKKWISNHSWKLSVHKIYQLLFSAPYLEK